MSLQLRVCSVQIRVASAGAKCVEGIVIGCDNDSNIVSVIFVSASIPLTDSQIWKHCPGPRRSLVFFLCPRAYLQSTVDAVGSKLQRRYPDRAHVL